MQQYKAIIFDLDGTLIDSLPYHFLSFKDLLLEHGIRVDDRNLRRLIGKSTEDILKEMKQKQKFEEDIQDMREERRFHYFKFLGKRNIVFPGVVKTLRELRLSYKIAIGTGSSKIVFTHSADGNFKELFDEVITINDVKRGKPHPEQFLLTARKLRVKPADCLVIGDSIYDAIAAQRAGMDFIGVTTGYTRKSALKEYGAKETIRSISALPRVLMQMQKKARAAHQADS